MTVQEMLNCDDFILHTCYPHSILRNPCILGDGSIISIQASAFHMCKPQDNFGPYTDVEIRIEKEKYHPIGDGDFPTFLLSDPNSPNSRLSVNTNDLEKIVSLHGGILMPMSMTANTKEDLASLLGQWGTKPDIKG